MIHLALVTEISAPVERCFDLARSIDLHTKSISWTGERAIAGVTSGLIGPGQDVTWRGRHFGLQMVHRSRITQYSRPTFFRDEMIKGQFRSFCHDHLFEERESKTIMNDVLQFEAPLSPAGWIVERLILRRYMQDLLTKRNEHIRRVAEGNEWAQYLQ